MSDIYVNIDTGSPPWVFLQYPQLDKLRILVLTIFEKTNLNTLHLILPLQWLYNAI